MRKVTKDDIIQALVKSVLHQRQKKEDEELTNELIKKYAASINECNFRDCRYYCHRRRKCRLEECAFDYHDEDQHYLDYKSGEINGIR